MTCLCLHDTKEIAQPAVIETVRNAYIIGERQFEAYVKDRIIDRTKPIDDPISRNKLQCFGGSLIKTTSKGKQQITSMKNDMKLFSRLYISCQTRDGNLENIFQHENQACPPDNDLTACLKHFVEAHSEVPVTTSVVLDGAAIVQMLKPSTAKTFDDHAHEIFIPYISSHLQRVSRLDLNCMRHLH